MVLPTILQHYVICIVFNNLPFHFVGFHTGLAGGMQGGGGGGGGAAGMVTCRLFSQYNEFILHISTNDFSSLDNAAIMDGINRLTNTVAMLAKAGGGGGGAGGGGSGGGGSDGAGGGGSNGGGVGGMYHSFILMLLSVSYVFI